MVMSWMLLWLEGAMAIMLVRSPSIDEGPWRASCITMLPGPYCPWVLWLSYWVDATEAGWLYGEYWAMGLALPD